LKRNERKRERSKKAFLKNDISSKIIIIIKRNKQVKNIYFYGNILWKGEIFNASQNA